MSSAPRRRPDAAIHSSGGYGNTFIGNVTDGDTVLDLEDEEDAFAAFNRSRASQPEIGSKRRIWSALGTIALLVIAGVITAAILHWLPL